jgi:hypothetical protein
VPRTCRRKLSGKYASFGFVGVHHATICMPWAFTVAPWHVEGPTVGAYIATTGVATYDAPPGDCAALRYPVTSLRAACRSVA